MALKVIENKIFGEDGEDKNLYLIVWQRCANSGMMYCFGNSEEDVYNKYSWKENKAVRHTIIKIDRSSMPVTDGRKAN